MADKGVKLDIDPDLVKKISENIVDMLMKSEVEIMYGITRRGETEFLPVRSYYIFAQDKVADLNVTILDSGKPYVGTINYVNEVIDLLHEKYPNQCFVKRQIHLKIK